MEPRRDRARAQSPSINASPVHYDHISRSHSVLSRHALRDQEMYDLRVQVRQLRQQLPQRVHVREHRSVMPSSNSSSGEERSHRRRTRSPRGSVHGVPSHSVRGERHSQEEWNTKTGPKVRAKKEGLLTIHGTNQPTSGVGQNLELRITLKCLSQI